MLFRSTAQTAINALLVREAQQSPVVVRLKGGDASIFGRLEEELLALDKAGIDSEVVPGVTAAIAAAAPPPAPELKPEMLARVQIVVQQRQDVLIVPTAAIRTVGKRRFVEYMDGAVKRSRNVEIGISTEQDTEIVSGVEEGLAILAGA